MDGSSEQSVGAFGSASQDAAGPGMPDSGGSGSSLAPAAADLGSPVSGTGEASGTRPVAGLGEADSLASSLEEMKGDFVDLMRRLHQARATSRTVPEGVTPAEARAVHVVWLMSRQGEAARPGSVAAHMHTTPSALSQILKSLEEKGLLVRHRTREAPWRRRLSACTWSTPKRSSRTWAKRTSRICCAPSTASSNSTSRRPPTPPFPLSKAPSWSLRAWPAGLAAPRALLWVRLQAPSHPVPPPLPRPPLPLPSPSPPPKEAFHANSALPEELQARGRAHRVPAHGAGVHRPGLAQPHVADRGRGHPAVGRGARRHRRDERGHLRRGVHDAARRRGSHVPRGLRQDGCGHLPPERPRKARAGGTRPHGRAATRGRAQRRPHSRARSRPGEAGLRPGRHRKTADPGHAGQSEGKLRRQQRHAHRAAGHRRRARGIRGLGLQPL